MQNERSFDVVKSSNGPTQPTPSVGAALPQSPIENFIQQVPQQAAAVVGVQQPARHIPWRLIGIGAAIVILGVGLFFVASRNTQTSQLQAGDFGTVDLPLSTLEAQSITSDTAKSLKVNGQLQVSDSVVLTPGAQPSSAVTGQMYFDQTSNKLAYYNGQEFITVGNGDTVINNFLTGAGNGVQLQSSTPGTQQVGNFNISGTGAVGTLKTTVVTSDGGTLYFNPTASTAQQSVAAGTPATLGLTNGSITTGTGWANELIATKATMGAVGGTATSISIKYGAGNAANHVQVAIYDDDGDLPSHPGNLIATSAVVNVVPNGITTVTIPTTILAANTTYWLAVNTDDTTVTRTYNGGSRASCFVSKLFGFMPDPFNAGGCFFDDNVYTIYANYITGGGASGTLSQAQFSLSTGGQALFRNTEDATNGFQVQNASGLNTIFNIDTINGRVAIGKATAGYKLDIAGGDINLSNGRSLRFAGLQALSTNGSGDTTVVSNFVSGGTVSVQSANFKVQDADGSNAMLTVDATNFKVYIGNTTPSNTPVVLYLSNKNTAGDPAGDEGATYYNSTLKSFRCYYNGAWHNCADIEPQHGFSFYDDFMGGQTSFTGQIGSLGWNAAAIGANGSLAMNPSTPTPSADRPGVLQVQTPASANQGTTLLLGTSGAASMLIAKDNDLKVAVAAGAATGQVVRVGLHTQTTATAQPLSGVWWEADPATNANWRYCHGDGTTATCANSAVAIAANTWVTLEIRVTATGNGTSAATFVINNTPVTVSAVTIDTTNRVSPALSCYGTTGSAQNCYWDYFQLTGTTSTTR